jgi:hypothetical protein
MDHFVYSIDDRRVYSVWTGSYATKFQKRHTAGTGRYISLNYGYNNKLNPAVLPYLHNILVKNGYSHRIHKSLELQTGLSTVLELRIVRGGS